MFPFKLKSIVNSASRIIRDSTSRLFRTTPANCDNQLPKEKLNCPILTLASLTAKRENSENQAQVCPIEVCKEQPKIIIIGAGIAGLSSAKRLTQIGFRNITVLEATDRPGGRVDSRWFGDIFADLGAPWTEDLDVIPPSEIKTSEEAVKKITESKPQPIESDTIPSGYVGGVTPLLQGLPKGSVCYKKPVETITWNNDGARRALVKCVDGEEILADFVIVTMSLGYLKRNAHKFFKPALTFEKMQAIQDLGYDIVEKVFMEYETPLKDWHKADDLCYFWDSDELASEKDWAKGIRLIEKCDNSQHVIHAVVSGPDATLMNTAADNEVALVITRILKQVSSNPSVPLPKNILRSRWSNNQYFCGAHSYMEKNSKITHPIYLADSLPPHNQSIPPVLLFAGEATSPGHFGSVQGARISGIREAERIGHLTKKLSESLKHDKK